MPISVPEKPPTKSAVVEDQELDRRAQPERDDGQVDAAGPHGGEREQRAERHRRQHAGHQRQRERPAGGVDQPAGDERPEAGERELGQRQLPGVARDHDDRQQHEAHGERRDEGVLPVERHERDDDTGDDQGDGEHSGPDPSAAHGGQALQEVVAQRQCLAAQDHPHAR